MTVFSPLENVVQFYTSLFLNETLRSTPQFFLDFFNPLINLIEHSPLGTIYKKTLRKFSANFLNN